MSPEKIATIKRLAGDSEIILSLFHEIEERLSYESFSNEGILFNLHKIVDKCDHIASQIETEFKKEEI